MTFHRTSDTVQKLSTWFSLLQPLLKKYFFKPIFPIENLNESYYLYLGITPTLRLTNLRHTI